MKRFVLLFVTIAFLTGANWSIEDIEDHSEGASIGGTGDGPEDTNYTAKLATVDNNLGLNRVLLCSTSNSIPAEQEYWDETFTPSSDYNPPGSWPVTEGSNPDRNMRFEIYTGTNLQVSTEFEILSSQ